MVNVFLFFLFLVYDIRFRISGFRVKGLGFRVEDVELRI
jgi:hypothetical protein